MSWMTEILAIITWDVTPLIHQAVLGNFDQAEMSDVNQQWQNSVDSARPVRGWGVQGCSTWPSSCSDPTAVCCDKVTQSIHVIDLVFKCWGNCFHPLWKIGRAAWSRLSCLIIHQEIMNVLKNNVYGSLSKQFKSKLKSHILKKCFDEYWPNFFFNLWVNVC